MSNNMINNACLSSFNAPNKVSKNVIIGANFTTNPWQRGSTFTSIATATYCADRWRVDYVSTAVTDIINTSDSPTVAQALFYSQNCLRMVVTTDDATIAAGDFYNITQRIEGYSFSLIAQRAFTMSFWVKAAKTGTYCVSFVNSGADRSYVAEYTISAANTWEKKTINVSASPSAGTWDYTNGIGLSVSFAQACGSTFQTTADAWQTGAFYGTSNQVNNLDTIGNDFRVDLIQIETGTVATPFQMNSEQEVLTACQRYYAKTFPLSVAPAQNVASNNGCIVYRAQNSAISGSGQQWRFPVVMRSVTPTITTYNPFNTNADWRNISLAADSGTPTLVSTSDGLVYVGNPQVVGDIVTNQMLIHATSDAEL